MSGTFLILRLNEQDIIINARMYSIKVPANDVIFLIKLQYFRPIFEKYSNAEFHEIPSSGSEFVPCGWTDGQADMTKLVVAFLCFADYRKSSR